jgi:hypothetical protein
MPSSGIKINRIKAQNKQQMDLLEDVLAPGSDLYKRVPRLEEIAEARVAHKNKFNTIQKLSQFGATGFNEERSLQYVAQIDQAIWSAVLAVFAQYDEQGNLVDDGLLYKKDHRGNIIINRDFFYALLEGPLKNYDMRGKNSIMV